uniref:Uncharacterized protein n=1 Tax=Rhizophora mucronata TaxID=61149 RepID=A0A2P2Q1J6_RHIMU
MDNNHIRSIQREKQETRHSAAVRLGCFKIKSQR